MKRQGFVILLTMLMSMTSIVAFAYNAKVDGIYYNFSGTEAAVTYLYKSSSNSSAYSGSVVIPENVIYNGTTYTVTSIEYEAFRYCNSLTSVTIPNSVTSIGIYAFSGCCGLTSVTIGKSVTSIGDHAFQGCSGLKEVNYNATNCTIMGSSSSPVFYGCSSLTTLNIGDNVQTIPSYAFYGCSGLTSITIPNSVTSLGSSAFYGCSGLMSITIPNSVTSLGSSAFYGCSELMSITIPNSVTSLGSYAFYGCSGLQSVVVGNGVISIPDCAFGTGKNIKSFTVGTCVQSISDFAFYNNSTYKPIKTIWLTNTPPSGYSNAAGTINYVANDLYSSLSNKTVYKYLSSSFVVDGVKYVPVSPSERTCDAIDCLYDENAKNIHIGETVTNTNDGTTYTVTAIGGAALYNCSKLTSITIPNSVTSIGSYAFYKCSGLTNITISNSVTGIGNYAFYGCSGLTSVTIPNSVTSLGNSAFYGCSGLQSVVVGNGVTNIPDYAFGTGTNINSFTVGTGVLSISSYAFKNSSIYKPTKTIWLTNTPPSGYSNAAGTINYVANNLYTSLSNKTEYKFLSSLFEVDGVKYVPVSPSERTCDAIDCLYDENAENIHIGETVTNEGITLKVNRVHPYACYSNQYIKETQLDLKGDIGNNAFYNCNHITTATIANAGNVGEKAFYDCDNITTATIANAGNVGDNAFYDCDKLATVNITNTGNIGNYAFQSCDALTTATIANTGAIGTYAFSSCTALQTATLGEKVTGIGQYAFSGCSSLQSIVIPNAVTTIGQYAFQNCSSMTSVKMGNGVSLIDRYTFSGCSKLTDMQIGSKVGTIDYDAFYNCTSLSKITIPQSVTKINDYVFKGCTQLKDVYIADRNTILTLGSNGSSPLFSSCPLDSVYIGGNISYNTGSSYGYSPFYRNTTLRSVVITDKETEISENEFYGCTSLKNISIGDGVESIGNWAFSGCASLDYFAFGTALKTIGKEAFSDCTAVTQIISRAATPPTCGSQALDDINKWTCTLNVPPDGVTAYQTATQWKEFFFIQEENAANLWFKLTYMVDGEEYKSYNKLYGTDITPEAEPTKDDYTFSGWSPIPETMPARDVIIVGTFTKNPEEQPYEPDLSQTDNVIYINSAEVRVGSELTLAIKMKNNVAIRGFQFDLFLPDGVTPAKTGTGKVKAALNVDRLPEDDAHTLTVSELQDGAIRFLCGSQYDETFTGTDGEVVTVRLNIAEDMEGGTYPIVLRNIKLTETNIERYYVADGISAMLTVLSYVTGDISGDNIVDVSDYIGIANHIMGNTPEGFNEKAADVNADNAIDVSDYIGVANIIMTGSVYGNNANGVRGMMRKANTDVSTIDNVIYIEPFQTAAGTQQLSLKMKNAVAIRGFQFDLYLPEGIIAAKTGTGKIKASLTAARLPEDDEHTLTVNEQPDGAIRFLCSSQYDETFTGTDGEIATLTINIDAGVAVADYPVYLRNMKLTETDISKFYTTDEVETTVTVTGAADGRVVLDETSTTAPENAHGVNVRVKRTINAGEWSTICLPFAMSQAQCQAAFGSDVQIGDFTGCTVVDDNVSVNFSNVTAMEANHPYIIKVSSAVSEFTVDGVDIAADNAEVKVNKSGRKYNRFIGNYENGTELEDGFLFLNANKFYFSNGSTKIKAFRGYFNLETADAYYEESRRIVLNFGDATGIETIVKDEADKVFNLSGQRVKTPAKGLYVKNGKKVIVK